MHMVFLDSHPVLLELFFLILSSKTFLLFTTWGMGAPDSFHLEHPFQLIYQITTEFCIPPSPGSPFTNDSSLNVDLCVIICFTAIVSP